MRHCDEAARRRSNHNAITYNQPIKSTNSYDRFFVPHRDDGVFDIGVLYVERIIAMRRHDEEAMTKFNHSLDTLFCYFLCWLNLAIKMR